ncbi:hypothetical protein ACIBCD_03915 [Nocardia brasiliensis]|uniref:hypothetical protein n=1 Tax=Nocardia brasiliensis TaxID=37326 RepID=UPI0037BC87B0
MPKLLVLVNGLPGSGEKTLCAVAPELARERYQRRCRAALHRDERRLADDWREWAQRAEPLGLTPTVLVDTTGPVDCMTLAAQVEEAARPYPFRAG